MPDPLPTYLNDHLAGARAAIDLLQSMRSRHPAEPIGHLAANLLEEIRADRETLAELARQVSGRGSTMKEAAAWVAAKVNRIKLRIGASDRLGTYEAVEGLCLGVLGKAALWSALAQIAPSDPRLRRLDYQTLIDRARQQHERLDRYRLALAPVALRGRAQSA